MASAPVPLIRPMCVWPAPHVVLLCLVFQVEDRRSQEGNLKSDLCEPNQDEGMLLLVVKRERVDFSR